MRTAANENLPYLGDSRKIETFLTCWSVWRDSCNRESIAPIPFDAARYGTFALSAGWTRSMVSRMIACKSGSFVSMVITVVANPLPRFAFPSVRTTSRLRPDARARREFLLGDVTSLHALP